MRTLAALALLFAAAPAAAGTYSATPAEPLSERFITRDIVWTCGPAACQGATETSRPIVLCQSLARRAGRITSFVADGRAFAASELDRCNASAKDSPPPSLANAR